MNRTPARCVVLVTLCAFAAQATPAPLMLGEKLVVHEWGTFTTVPGDDGDALYWKPLAWKSDLPSFVHTSASGPAGLRVNTGVLPSGGKGDHLATVRMETPVLYFYPDRERDVSVRVDFRGGVITEWYPFANGVGSFIDWGTVHLMPQWHPPLLTEPAKSHYYPAREAGAAMVRVCGDQSRVEYDNLLFYRGVGYFQSSLKVTVRGADVVVNEREGRPLGRLLVFERRGNASSVVAVDTRASSVEVRRGALALGDGGVRAQLHAQLLAAGLYEKEAAAMLSTWNDDWFEEGLRVLHLLPQGDVEKLLPLTVNPVPTSLERVMVGRVELLAPDRRHDAVEKLRAAFAMRGPARAAAEDAALAPLGRFAAPWLGLFFKDLSEPEQKQLGALVQRLAAGPEVSAAGALQ